MDVAARENMGNVLFANGWDEASAVLSALVNGEWQRYRLPKASHAMEHAWQIEWMRIREVETEHFLLDIQGLFYWSCGIEPDALTKDVRLEACHAPRLRYGGERFAFPVRNYRWHAMDYQHTYLALAVNQAKLYYHRGEDFRMIPDLEQVLAITDAVVTVVPGPDGDRDSNYVVLEDGAGLRFLTRHANCETFPSITAMACANRGRSVPPTPISGAACMW